MGMKKAVLIHGWDGYPEEGWRPWLKVKLEKEGFKVLVPLMPDTSTPTLEKWLPFLSKTVGDPDSQTFFIGHSLGCITILRYLEALTSNQSVGGAISVAGFGYDLEYKRYKGELSSFFKTPVDWEKIKKHCKKFVVIHSSDDPWVPVKHAEYLKEKLHAKSIIQNGMSHYSGDDGITELPLVLKELLRMSKKT